MSSSGSTVIFEPEGKQSHTNADETLLGRARKAGVKISAICGGRGLCRACVIRFTEGRVPEPSKQDILFLSQNELDNGWRRACQCMPVGDCTVNIPAQNEAAPLRSQINYVDVEVRPDAVVQVYRVKVPEPLLETPRADDQRLLSSLSEKWPGIAYRIDPAVNLSLSSILDETKGSVAVVVRLGEVVGILPRGSSPLLGLAVDLGTTNIGVLLVDLRNGRTLSTRGAENPQVMYGGDILTRIGYAMSSPGTIRELQQLVIDEINHIADVICTELSLNPQHIADIVVAGNTAMHHLFLGLPVDKLTKVPFAPCVSAGVDIKAREIGLTGLPGAVVHLMPNIAGYVGGDHTAALLALQSISGRETEIVLDIGTNTEISLIRNRSISSLSCPSGPALEGGNIQCGMRSSAGAIESVDFDGIDFVLQTIDGASAAGICGSGVLDILAKLYLAGVVSAQGRLIDEHHRLRSGNGCREFLLDDKSTSDSRDIVFTQLDIRAVQLAKSTIRTGIEILMEDAGISICQVDQIVIAGAFGNHIDINSAKAIGMLPDLSNDKYSQIGNAAGIGAKLALVSYPHRVEAASIAINARYLELSGLKDFNAAFMKNLSFPKI